MVGGELNRGYGLRTEGEIKFSRRRVIGNKVIVKEWFYNFFENINSGTNFDCNNISKIRKLIIFIVLLFSKNVFASANILYNQFLALRK